MTLRLITAPASEPVTRAEAKLQCRVDSDITTDDDLIDALITSARQECEHLTGRALITQTWERVVDAFPLLELELGMPKVASITGVYYYDTTGTEVTLGSSAYVLDSAMPPGWVLPAYGYQWPTTYDTANAVRVRFVSGYGAASDVPAAIKTWCRMRIADLYQHRGGTVVGQSVTQLGQRFYDRLLDPYTIHYGG